MKVFSLLGFIDYEGESLLGVYGSLKDVFNEFDRLRAEYKGSWKPEFFGYDSVGCVESELGEKIDVLKQIYYM